jgi:hypothetical protein
MYGTRKQLTRELKRAFTADEPLALLVWTTGSVAAWLGARGITDDEAVAILARIGNFSMRDHQSDGVSFPVIADLLNSVRADARQVNIPAELLARLNENAELALSIIRQGECDGGLPASELVEHGLEAVAQVRELLAA